MFSYCASFFKKKSSTDPSDITLSAIRIEEYKEMEFSTPKAEQTTTPEYTIIDVDEDDEDGKHDTDSSVLLDSDTEREEHEELVALLKEFDVLPDDLLLDDEIEKLSEKEKHFLVKLLAGILALLTAAPTALFALTMLSGITMKEAGENISGWWNGMELYQKILSLINGGSAEYVNFKINYDFFGDFWKDLKQNFTNFNAKKFLSVLVPAIFGFFGGICAGAIAFEALESFLAAAIAFGAINGGVYFVSRYIGVDKLIKRILNRKDIRQQREIIDQLNHLKDDYKLKLEKHLKKVTGRKQNEQLDSQAYFESLFKEIGDKLARMKVKYENETLFNEKTRAEMAKEFAGTTFDITLASLVSIIALISFTNKTCGGVKTLLELLTGKDFFENLSNPARIPAGIVGGFASAGLYGIRAYDFRGLLIETCDFLYENPKQIPAFMLQFAMNGFGVTGMFNIGRRIPGPNNEFNIPLNTSTYWLFALICALGAFIVNIKPTLAAFTATPDTKNPNLEQLKKYFRNPSLHAVSHDNLCFFTPKKEDLLRANAEKLAKRNIILEDVDVDVYSPEPFSKISRVI